MTATAEHLDETATPCPLCGSYKGTTLAQSSALLAVADVLVIKALEVVGKRLVRVDRSRHKRRGTRPMHEVHAIWTPDPSMMDKGLSGAWDVIPAMLTAHGCCGVTADEVQAMVDRYVRDLLITGTLHNLDDLRYRFEAYLHIPMPDPRTYSE